MSLASELKELTELFESGKLTEDEFALAKKQLLSNSPIHPKPGASTAQSTVEKQTKERESPQGNWDKSAKPLKTIVSVFVCIAASGAIVFAAFVPFKVNGLIECGTPLREALRSSTYSNPDYDPSYVKSGDFFIDGKYGEKTLTNTCVEPARERLVIPGVALALSVGILYWLWRPKVPDRSGTNDK